MIKSTELRIGNYLQSSCIIKIDAKFIYEYDKVGGNYKPIPLTEEILLNAGFVSIVENNNVYTLKNKIYGMFKTEYNKDGSVSDTYLEIYNEGTPLVKIRTLHHLQNYVHAITQTELTINL